MERPEGKMSVQVYYSTHDQSRRDSACHMSRWKIDQSPPSFSCYLNEGVENHTWAKMSMHKAIVLRFVNIFKNYY